MQKLKAALQKKPQWTEEEINKLIKLKGERIHIREISKVLDRTPIAIKDKWKSVNPNKRRNHRWTEEEISQLHFHFNNGSTDSQIAKMMGRTRQAISTQRSLRNKSRKLRIGVTEETVKLMMTTKPTIAPTTMNDKIDAKIKELKELLKNSQLYQDLEALERTKELLSNDLTSDEHQK